MCLRVLILISSLNISFWLCIKCWVQSYVYPQTFEVIAPLSSSIHCCQREGRMQFDFCFFVGNLFSFLFFFFSCFVIFQDSASSCCFEISQRCLWVLICFTLIGFRWTQAAPIFSWIISLLKCFSLLHSPNSLRMKFISDGFFSGWIIQEIIHF